MLITMLVPALALTCDPDDRACNDANTVRDQLNLLTGVNTIQDDLGRLRFRTGRIVDTLTVIYADGEEQGCTFDGFMTVEYRNGADFAGTWTSTNGTQGENQGTFNRADNSFVGTFTNTAVPTFDGELAPGFGVFSNNFKFFGDRTGSGRFQGGTWIRDRGQKGVAWGVIGTCPGDIGAAFSTFFPGLPTEDECVPEVFAECLVDGAPGAPEGCPTACETAVCDADAFCCDTGWDSVCIDSTETFDACLTTCP